MDEIKLKKFLKLLIIWTDLPSKPDVYKMVLNELDGVFAKGDAQ